MSIGESFGGKPKVSSIEVKPMGKPEAASMLLKAIEAKDTAGIEAAMSLFCTAHEDDGSEPAS